METLFALHVWSSWESKEVFLELPINDKDVVEETSESPLLPQIHIQTKGGLKKIPNTPVVKFSDGRTPALQISSHLVNPKSITGLV